MLRCLNEHVARSFALERGEYYGLSVFGGWFVGPRAALIKIGVPDPKKGTEK